MPDTKKEVRAIGVVEMRATDGQPKKIVGYAAVFNSITDIGGYFREQIAPGAFADAIGSDDVRALFNHDSNFVLGRNTAGTLVLREDDKGLAFEVTPPDTQWAKDLMASIDRGDVTQCSFAFRARKEEWDESDPKALPLRTLLRCDLSDVSIVTYPAYEDTSAALRSLDSYRKEREAAKSTLSPVGQLLQARLRMQQKLRFRAR